MGLDYYIDLIILEKETKAHVASVELAYWRKCYSLRDVIHDDFARDNDYIIETDSDTYVKCEVGVLAPLVDELTELVRRVNDHAWSDSVWNSPTSVRIQTAKQLGKLIAAQEWFLNKKATPDNIAYDVGPYLEIDEDIVYDVCTNPDKYEVFIEFINSY